MMDYNVKYLWFQVDAIWIDNSGKTFTCYETADHHPSSVLGKFSSYLIN